jgi:hypothetical protein
LVNIVSSFTRKRERQGEEKGEEDRREIKRDIVRIKSGFKVFN